MNQPYDSTDPRQRQARRAALQKKRAQQRRRRLQIAGLAASALLVILLIILLAQRSGNRPDTPADTTNASTPVTDAIADVTWATFPADREITAQQYFVYDCTAGTFRIISHDANTRIYPASVTKLITANVVLQYLQPDQMITVGDALNMVAAGSSVAQLQKGDTLTVKDLIGGMILPSGNDAAQVLAVEAGRIILQNPVASTEFAVNAFVSQMNHFASQLGMQDTHFANPDGIHKEDHYTTFNDLVILAQQAISSPDLLEYCATYNAIVTAGNRQLQWHNTNLLVDPQSEYYCPYAIGLKTGQTPYAGSCLLSAFDVSGNKYVIGVFGCPDIDSRFADTLQLLNQTLSAY